MDRKDYQYIHNSLGKNNQTNTASRANNYIHNLFPPLNSQNIIIETHDSGINGQLKIYAKLLENIINNKTAGMIIHFKNYSNSIIDGGLVFCAKLQANTTYILNCLNRYRINYTINNNMNNSMIKPIQAFIATTTTEQDGYIFLKQKDIGNSGEDNYCYFYNKEECLMAFYIPSCAPGDKIQIDENEWIILTNTTPPLQTAVQLVASDVPYTLDLNEQITGINNITPFSSSGFDKNSIKIEDIVNILNNTPVQFKIDTNDNTIKIPQITNQTVIDFLKQNKLQREGEPTYPRYQLVLIPWRDFLKERECSNRKSRWKNNADGTRTLINTYKTFNTRYTCLYGHPIYGNENFDHLHSILLKCNMPFVDNSITCLQDKEVAYKIILNSRSTAETGQCLIHPQKFKKIVEVKHNPDDIEYFVKGNYINLIYKQKKTNGEYIYKRSIIGYMEPLAIANRLEKGCALANNTYKTLKVPYGWKDPDNSTQPKKTITYHNYAAISFSWGLVDLSYINDNDIPVLNLNFLNNPMYKIPFTNSWWKIFPEIEPHKFLPSMSIPILVPFKSDNFKSLDYDYQAKWTTVENTNYETINCIQLEPPKIKNSQ